MEACSMAGASNLVFIINELDKAASGKGNGNPADVLLTLLDNLGFTDNYIRVRRPVASPTEAEKLANTIDGFTLRRFVANEEVFEDC